ncbi:hypothetical protein pb186bvf_000959 [Paramecium bursaria]
MGSCLISQQMPAEHQVRIIVLQPKMPEFNLLYIAGRPETTSDAFDLDLGTQFSRQSKDKRKAVRFATTVDTNFHKGVRKHKQKMLMQLRQNKTDVGYLFESKLIKSDRVLREQEYLSRKAQDDKSNSHQSSNIQNSPLQQSLRRRIQQDEVLSARSVTSQSPSGILRTSGKAKSLYGKRSVRFQQ